METEPNATKHSCANCKCEALKSRRGFLKFSAKLLGSVAAGLATIPFVKSLIPAAGSSESEVISVDLAEIPAGEGKTIDWEGNPVFIRHRTEEEIAKAVADNKASDLIDPARDEDRVQKAEWLIVMASCTHMGCVPQGNKPHEMRGKHGGWLCQCHGAEYDVSGRVRKGPAPKNLPVPPYVFVSETKIELGKKA